MTFGTSTRDDLHIVEQDHLQSAATNGTSPGAGENSRGVSTFFDGPPPGGFGTGTGAGGAPAADRGTSEMNRFDSNNPRYKCCNMKIEVLAPLICYIEIGIIVLMLVITLPVAAAEAPNSLKAVSISLCSYGAIKLGITLSALWGILKREYQFLIAYLVFKAIEVATAAIGMLIAFLIMMGFSFVFGLTSTLAHSNSQKAGGGFDPDKFPDSDPDYGDEDAIYNADNSAERAVTAASGDYHVHVPPRDDENISSDKLTGIFVAVFIALGIILALGVFFFIVMMKCYRLSRDRTYVTYQHNLLSKANSLPSSFREHRGHHRGGSDWGPGGQVGGGASGGGLDPGQVNQRLAASAIDIRSRRVTTETDTELDDMFQNRDSLMMINGSPGRYVKLATTQTSFPPPPPPPYSRQDPSPPIVNPSQAVQVGKGAPAGPITGGGSGGNGSTPSTPVVGSTTPTTGGAMGVLGPTPKGYKILQQDGSPVRSVPPPIKEETTSGSGSGGGGGEPMKGSDHTSPSSGGFSPPIKSLTLPSK